MSFEGEQVYYTDQHLINAGIDSGMNNEQNSLVEAENKFMHFVRETQFRN